MKGMTSHKKNCYMNPVNIKMCPVCNTPVKNFRESTTCSLSCSNTYFRSGENNPRWKESAYRTTCFAYHEKECIICGEAKIVEVHHFDENNKNSSPDNLVPLCPTHHQYLHSRYRHELETKIIEYVEEFRRSRNVS